MRKITAIFLAALFALAAIGAARADVTYGMSLYGDFEAPKPYIRIIPQPA